MKRRLASLLSLLAFSLSCGATPSSYSHPPQAPTAEEVRSFLSRVAAAAASGKESDLHRFFEKGSSYPRKDFALIKGSEFWKLAPGKRVKRLGPDAFQIRLRPEEQPPEQGAIQVRVRIDLPVRRDKEGQLRILSRKESERLEKLPVPESPEGEAVVELDYPEEGDFGWEAGKHFATEFWVAASEREVRLNIRFEPPLTGPKLRADLPIQENFHFGEEIRVEMSLDADANGATGAAMDRFYERLKEIEKGFESANSQRVLEWKGFGTDRKLNIDGKKFVTEDGGRSWGLRASLRNVAPEVLEAGAWTDRGEKVFEKGLTDPELKVEGDVLTLTVPAALLPMKPGGAYRVMLEHNSGHSLRLKARTGKAGS